MNEYIAIEKMISEYLIPWSINISSAIIIFLAGKMLVKFIVSIVGKLMQKANIDKILINFVLSISNALLMLIVVIASIDRLGVDTTSLVAVVGAAGLAIGLALQGSLQNFASGVMLIIFQPFKTGDYIEAAGANGTVEHISIFNTILKTPDNKEVIIPNGDIYSGTIVNYSARSTRRVDMVFGISYQDDIDKAKSILQEIIDSEDRILEEPGTLIAVSELGDSSVNFVVRPWVNSSDYWSVKYSILERVKSEFDNEGISIPYPTIDVNMNDIQQQSST